MSSRGNYYNGGGQQQQQKQGPGPVPNRWLYCPRTAENIIADKFLAFKTPLSKRFEEQLPSECMFLPETVFSFAKMYKLKLALWIDLTNTSRFYDRKDIIAASCDYKKLTCVGHGECPSIDQTRSFIEIVDDFITNNPLDLIGVHCTHGFNRTGFLIASYMVERMDCSVEASILAFAAARPPGIYKQDYINELFRRYDEVGDALLAPQLPEWCYDNAGEEEEDYNNQGDFECGESAGGGTLDLRKRKSNEMNPIDSDTNLGSCSATSLQKKRKREFRKKNATFMDGVSGVCHFCEEPKLSMLQAKLQKMCNWEHAGFPGSQPVSLDTKNIEYLKRKPYRVSWKADGTRYMMLILAQDEIYFFDRDNSCFQVEGINFLRSSNLKEHLIDTALDGEMVIDKVNGQHFPRYLVYDVIFYDGTDVKSENFFPNRIDIIEKKIIKPRYDGMRDGIINRADEPFSIRYKNFYPITDARKLLAPKFTKSLLHEPDGLIFQPSNEPYMGGQCMSVLKWKPLRMNSVDFLLKIDTERGEGILTRTVGYLYVGKHVKPFAMIKYTKKLKEYHNKIIECKFENNSWIFMRERSDKSFPNSYDTAMAVCKSIENPVTTDMLLDVIERQREESALMPPPS